MCDSIVIIVNPSQQSSYAANKFGFHTISTLKLQSNSHDSSVFFVLYFFLSLNFRCYSIRFVAANHKMRVRFRSTDTKVNITIIKTVQICAHLIRVRYFSRRIFMRCVFYIGHVAFSAIQLISFWTALNTKQKSSDKYSINFFLDMKTYTTCFNML